MPADSNIGTIVNNSIAERGNKKTRRWTKERDTPGWRVGSFRDVWRGFKVKGVCSQGGFKSIHINSVEVIAHRRIPQIKVRWGKVVSEHLYCTLRVALSTTASVPVHTTMSMFVAHANMNGG